MSRPVTLLKDNTVYWAMRLYNSSQVLVDADSTPTVAVRKNGASTADVVTVTKRAATTGIYDCTYNPASEVEGDQYCVEESATISSQAYENSWSFVVQEAERGTNSASTFDATTDAVTTDAASRTASQVSQADIRAAVGLASANLDTQLGDIPTVSEFEARTLIAASYFDPSADTVTTDAASRTASQADVSALATSASIAALNDLSQADIRTAVGLASANLDTQLGDIPTVSEFEARTLVAASYFDPSTDSVTTDAASRTASQADVSSLATAASIAALNDFDPTTQTVTTDAASRTASQADVSGLATAASIAALNDFDPATEQVVASNMRGTDNANTIAPVDVSADVTAVKAVVDKLDTAMQLDGAVYQFTTNALERAPASGSGGVVGPGAISHTVTVNSGGNPVDGAEVWVSTDSSGNNVVAGTLTTDAFGKATFMLDAGSYYLWAQRSGVNFTNPTAFTVS